MNNPFEMIVAIVFLGVVASIITQVIKSRDNQRESSDQAFQEADELREQIVMLEERIKVLERIVTESNPREDLRRQFRNLEREA